MPASWRDSPLAGVARLADAPVAQSRGPQLDVLCGGVAPFHLRATSSAHEGNEEDSSGRAKLSCQRTQQVPTPGQGTTTS